jgi:2-polyprenyl-6-methoxyphenol hydroxylase-like FAD-dependent oxidoreductase
MRIAINGVGIAGPALAFWLSKSGHDVLLIEEAPHLRSGGYVVDFWGLGYDLAEKMGLLPEILEAGYQVEEVRFVNRHGRKCGGFPVADLARMTQGRFTSLRRSDLAACIYRALDSRVETLFGDSIATICEEVNGVEVGFDHAAPRRFDLVVGADGLHSRVRRIVFGKESALEYSLGCHVAAFEAEGYSPRDELIYISHNLPGRQISRLSMRNDKTMFLFVFRDEYLRGPEPRSDAERKAALTQIFSGAGWEWPRIQALLPAVGNLYFDHVSQIRMDHWTKGRTALIGDAAACVSLLAGEGTGLAMTEAYVLSGELRLAGTDFARAFGRYEERLMAFLKRKQETAAGFASAFFPKTSLGIAFRNLVTRLLYIPAVADFFIGRNVRDDFTIPEYGFQGEACNTRLDNRIRV